MHVNALFALAVDCRAALGGQFDTGQGEFEFVASVDFQSAVVARAHKHDFGACNGIGLHVDCYVCSLHIGEYLRVGACNLRFGTVVYHGYRIGKRVQFMVDVFVRTDDVE